MTIKVVRNPVSFKPARVECQNKECRALLEVSKDDCKYVENYDVRDPREHPYYTVKCPCCDRTTVVDMGIFRVEVNP